MMIGVTRQANPQLRLAGDSLGKADVSSLERLCAAQPAQQIPVHDALAREPARAGRRGAALPQPLRLRLLVVS